MSHFILFAIRDGERPMPRVMLAWLEDQGFLKPEERAYFRR